MADSTYITFSAACATVNAGANQNVTGDSLFVGGSYANATGVTWTTTGTGTFSNPNNAGTTYNASAADTAAGSVWLILTTNGGVCADVTDSAYITFSPACATVDAGSDLTISTLDSATLSGVFTNATGVMWSTSGSGGFTNASSANTAYWPSAADTVAGTVTLTLTTIGGVCADQVDSLILTIIGDGPNANAGPDITSCDYMSGVSIFGTIINAQGGIWSTSGSGVFNPSNTNLNTVYIPSSADISSGSVVLTLTTTGNGVYSPDVDNMTLTLNPVPVANAGFDQFVCANNATANLNGSVTNATGGQWSNGGGVFAPNSTSLNASYTLSAAEISAGVATLFLCSTGNGSCSADCDTMVVFVTPAPTADAGPDQSSCSVGTVNLMGVVTNANSNTWSTSGDGIFGNVSNLSTTYTPGANDSVAGMVVITLTASRFTCNDVADSLLITFGGTTTTNAGADQTVCADVPSINVNGAVTLAGGGQWTSTGTGTFADPNALNTTYTPSSADTASGSLVLTLSSTGNGSCTPSSDSIIINFINSVPVNAGPDFTACADPIPLVATSSSGATDIWITSGSGTFSDSVSLSSTYSPSPADYATGFVTLTLTSYKGGCSAQDDVVITLGQTPVVNAGANQTLDMAGVQLNGSVVNDTNWVWSTNGSGTFSPNASALNAIYLPSTNDSIAGNVVLTLSSFGACPSVTDAIVLSNGPLCNLTVNSTITGNTVDFSATNTDVSVLGAYFWEFGDGNNGAGKNQTHTYTSVGDYYVTAYFTAADSTCFASVVDTVSILSVPAMTYSIAGQITGGGTPLDAGIINLYRWNGTNYVLFKTSLVSGGSGVYTFTGVKDGNYLVHALLDSSSSLAGNYQPTYYGDATKWVNAQGVQVSGANRFNINVALTPFSVTDGTWNTGNDTLSGNVTFTDSLANLKTSSTNNPVQEAIVYLINSSGEIVAYTITNEYGQYKFTNLIAGNYTIGIEYPGTAEIVQVPVTIDGNGATQEQAPDIDVTKEKVTLSISENLLVEDVDTYPNPAIDVIKVKSIENGLIIIFNTYGEVIISTTYVNNTIDISDLSSGVYFVRVIAKDKIYRSGFVKQ